MSAQAQLSEAQSFVCEHGAEIREVAVNFAEGNQLPCSVTYTKYGKEETLWQAKHKANFCGVRAQELIAKLERTGWECTLNSDADLGSGDIEPTSSEIAPVADAGNTQF
jgi:hypothetical protein